MHLFIILELCNTNFYGVNLALSLGNNDAFLTFSRLSKRAVNLSRPIARTLCGGIPYLKIEV